MNHLFAASRQPGIKKRTVVLFSLCFTLAMVTGRFLDRNCSFGEMRPVQFLLYLVIVTALLPPVIFVTDRLYLLAFRTGRKSCRPPETGVQRVQLRTWLMLSLLLFFCWIPVWLAYWPGIWAYDAPNALEVTYHTYSTHHPLLYDLWLGICYTAGKLLHNDNAGLALYTAAQMLLMSAIFGYAAAFLRTVVRSRALHVFVILFYALMPINSLFAINPTKDVPFAGLITLIMIKLLQSPGISESPESVSAATFRVILGVLVLLARNNSVYAVIILVFSGFLLRKRINIHRTRLLLLCMVPLIWFPVSRSMEYALDATQGSSKEALSIPIQQFGRIHEFGKVEDKVEVENYFNYPKAQYVPAISDNMKFYMYELEPGELMPMLKQSLRWVFYYPLVSLDSLLYLTKGHWDPGDRTHADLYRVLNPDDPQGYIQTHIWDYPLLPYDITRNSKFPRLESFYTSLFTNNRIFDIPVLRIFFTPALYHWLFAFCAIGWWSYAKKRHSLYLVFLWGLLLTMLAGPCSLIRYSYPFVACAPVMLIMLFFYAGMPQTEQFPVL